MNIALEKTAEYVNGVKRRTYGDAFVRGNNGKSEACRHVPHVSAYLCLHADDAEVMYISADE